MTESNVYLKGQGTTQMSTKKITVVASTRKDDLGVIKAI